MSLGFLTVYENKHLGTSHSVRDTNESRRTESETHCKIPPFTSSPSLVKKTKI